MDGVQILDEKSAANRIIESVRMAKVGEAPFALVLGSGFSRGLVPMVRDLVGETLPLWLEARRTDGSLASQQSKSVAARDGIVAAFWRAFASDNAIDGLKLELDQRGFPSDCAAAYQAIFDSRYSGGLGDPRFAREFQRELMQLDKPRLNAPHFLLASILAAQPGMTSASSALFKHRAAFARLILTTNFDPFLQMALQAVGRLYFMTDRPDLDIGDTFFNDPGDAIHLVYVHGSVHRPFQAATIGDIEALRRKNARFLSQVLQRCGVIVLGYSGWDDAIVEALLHCERFDHRLYWCGLDPDPLRPGAYGGRVAEILRKQTVSYVKIAGAGSFMAQLFNGLVKGAPRLLDNPVAQMRDLLQIIDLQELDAVETTGGSDTNERAQKIVTSNPSFARLKDMTLSRLEAAELAFSSIVDGTAASADATSGTVAKAVGVTDTGPAGELDSGFWSAVNAAELLGNHEEELALTDKVLANQTLSITSHVSALMIRARTLFMLGRITDATNAWTTVIELPGAPLDEVATALYNRGVSWLEQGEGERAIVDYTRVIERTGATAEEIAMALVNRGVTWGMKEKHKEEMADYDRVIDLPNAPLDQIAKALFNRAVVWGARHEFDKAIADFTRVIELRGAPTDQIAKALVNRALAWDKRGDSGKAIADYTRVIELLPEVPQEQVADAYGGRGWTRYVADDFPGFLTDTETSLKYRPSSIASFNFGLALLANGRDTDALKAYRRAAEQFPDRIAEDGLEDVHAAIGKWLTDERARPVLELLVPAPTQES